MEFREMDLFDFTRFFGLDFFKFSGSLCSCQHFNLENNYLYIPGC